MDANVQAGPRTVAGSPARSRRPAGWAGAARRAAGFTIVELIVSLGVLGILGTMAGAIFALTLSSSGQASALIEVSQSVRALEQTLREDLRHVDPGSCILAIQSNPVHAYWRAEEREALSAPPALAPALVRDPEREVAVGAGIQRAMPRADLLMFFTYRPGTSFRDPDVTGRIQCVVYGHAETGELQPDGRWLSGAPKWFVSPEEANANIFSPLPAATTPNALMAIPARQWHLARRGLLILDRASSTEPPFAAADPNDGPDGVGMMSADDDPMYSGLDMRYAIRDGRRDYLVDGEVGSNEFRFEYIVDWTPDPQRDTDPADPGSIVSNFMYRSQMDPEPPASQAQRMGHYFLPNCASFKVEWAVDVSNIKDSRGNNLTAYPKIPYNRELLWIDPHRLVDTIAELEQIRNAPDFDPSGTEGTELMERIISSLDPTDPVTRFGFGGAPRRTHVFYPRNPLTPDAPTPDPLFPRALRITVDVFDSGGRLERPIRHVMIVPVGQG